MLDLINYRLIVNQKKNSKKELLVLLLCKIIFGGASNSFIEPIKEGDVVIYK